MTQQIRVPRIQIQNLRGDVQIPWSRALSFLVLGTRYRGGKSALLEVIALRFPKIFDLYSSTSNEGLAWCKPEFADYFKSIYGRLPNILLVHGEGIEVSTTHNKCKYNQISISLFESYDIIIVCKGLYLNNKDYYKSLYDITDLLWTKRLYYREIWFVLVREASEWAYSRVKAVKDDQRAKASFISALRQAYHSGLAVGTDTLRWTDIDKIVRDLSSILFLKCQGRGGLPRELWWLYKYVAPEKWKALRPDVFIVIDEREAVGYGRFDYPPWHKERKENIFKSTNIEIKRIGKPQTEKYSVTDFQHKEIVELYFQKKSMKRVGEELTPPRSSRTVSEHIHTHNKAIEINKRCPICEKTSCAFFETYIEIPKRGTWSKKE